MPKTATILTQLVWASLLIPLIVCSEHDELRAIQPEAQTSGKYFFLGNEKLESLQVELPELLKLGFKQIGSAPFYRKKTWC